MTGTTGAPHRLDPTTARRLAVRAQRLEATRPTDLVGLVRDLDLLQIDPTAAIAPNADLVAWSRLGGSYRPSDLVEALEHDRTLFELDALIRPIDALELLRPEMASFPEWPRSRTWLEQNDDFRRDVLKLLEGAREPLPSRDIPDTSAVPWESTGWTHDRNVGRMLEFLALRGEVAIAGRQGRERLWTLAERVYPTAEAANGRALTVEAATAERNARRLSSLGIARAKSTKMPLEPIDVGITGEPAVVDGVPGEWRVDPVLLEGLRDEASGPPFEGRTALLSPFDRLIYDRKRALQLFDFEYTLEMYKPAAKRRWGYYALPILAGDRLVGKLDAKADRAAGVLVVKAVHEDVPFDRATRRAVDDEIASLAEWLGLEVARRDVS
ncbi:crosslink repair DNA glycosylase YcaQ family protein [Agromyces sp. H3Y2-19a]|uniref:DNA glycosylase AlkZ-like family protein n=1 Tax=Agromyces TaxID=33877 RepID=UPI001E2FB4B9|nr:MULTISPECIES: crosslink repair DNA glycosylase YcaQ family protein [Agromyces]MCD5348171.1 winged helix DNA-binding domain-containing protein [Agromyces sp. S2-1-8]MDF0514225.1 crosslink repair DNA glycosylase YcaQ family protein [Agromyces chromiiresistens]